jgi:hypothetical protein
MVVVEFSHFFFVVLDRVFLLSMLSSPVGDIFRCVVFLCEVFLLLLRF